MHNHSPKNYKCPFCLLELNQNDQYTVYQDKDIKAFISNREWPPNSGVVLIIPNQHFENLYDMPDKLLSKIHIFSKNMAKVMKKAYKSDGILIRQHNEPSGNQTVFHYHVQVVPRYDNDRFYGNYENSGRTISDKDRAKYAKLIKKHFHGK